MTDEQLADFLEEQLGPRICRWDDMSREICTEWRDADLIATLAAAIKANHAETDGGPFSESAALFSATATLIRCLAKGVLNRPITAMRIATGEDWPRLAGTIAQAVVDAAFDASESPPKTTH